jgi:hypothetical protein
MKRWIGLPAGVLAVVALLGVAAIGADKDTDKDKAAKADEAAKNQVDLSDLGTAFQLIEYGRDQDAPEALITAAGLLNNVSRAKIQDLKAKAEVLDSAGAAVDDKTKPHAAAKVDLAQEAKDLIEEAEVLALKQKVNLSALVKAVKNRKMKTEGAGELKYYGRVLGGQQTLVIPAKVDGNQVNNLAIRSTEAVRVSVIKKDDKNTLAATLTTAGNLPFKANKGEAVTRGVVVVRRVIPIRRPVVVVRPLPPRRVIPVRIIRRRGIGDGDTEVVIRVENPSKSDADVELFFN